MDIDKLTTLTDQEQRDFDQQVLNFLKVFDATSFKQDFEKLLSLIKEKVHFVNYLLSSAEASSPDYLKELSAILEGIQDQQLFQDLTAVVDGSKKEGLNFLTAKRFYINNCVNPLETTLLLIKEKLNVIEGVGDVDSEEVLSVKPEWDKRPSEREEWLPEDYVRFSISEIKPADVAQFPNGVSVRGEFNRFVGLHPEFSQYENYWKTVLTTWTTLFKADPKSGSGGFTSDFKAFMEQGFQQTGFDVGNVHEILRNEKFGDLSMRIMALIELIMFDNGENSFEYVLDHNLTTIGPVDNMGTVIFLENKKPEKDRREISILQDDSGQDLKKGKKIVVKGQFFARSMDGQENNLRSVIEYIIQDQNWIEKTKAKTSINSAETHLLDNIVSHVFRLDNVFDVRGHFFLDDTASAVTKGFGGEDYAWATKPQSTVGYDMNRYSREPSASHYFLAAVDVPNEWHRNAAHNDLFKPSGLLVFSDVNKSRVSQLDDDMPGILLIYERLETKTDVENTDYNNLKLAYQRIERFSAEARIQAGLTETHRIRSWFHGFMSETDMNMCLKQALGEDVVAKGHALPIEFKNNKYQFVPKGSTFPTIYDLYVGQMIKKAVPIDGRVITAGVTNSLDMQSILWNDGKFNTYAKKYFIDSKEERKRGLSMYHIAISGWKQALDVIKEPPQPIDGDALLRKVDKFLGMLGMAKIVNGAHHNMMNTIALLYFVKLFKYLKPRNYQEYIRIRNLTLEKVQDQDSSQSGGGIPPQVKIYLTWLLSEAKSDQRGSSEKNGDLLRPMNPSHHEQEHQEIEEETRGMDNGMSKWFRIKMIKLEHWVHELGEEHEDKDGESDIPKGPIKWDNQNTDTKGS